MLLQKEKQSIEEIGKKDKKIYGGFAMITKNPM